MGKPSRSRGRGRRTAQVRPGDSDDEILKEKDPDVKSRSYVYDEIDEFHANREKVLLEAGRRFQLADESDEEEVYAIGGSEDDSDDEDPYGVSAAQKKEDMASDLEDEDDDLPNVKAWGKRKSSYYNTDYVDKDYDKYDASDIEMAEAEESEAKAIQQRMAEQLDDGDFGLDFFKIPEKTADKKDELKIEKDFSQLSKQEKLEILERESPEMLSLLQDFKDKLLEIKDCLQPLFELVKSGEIPSGPQADYIHLKYQLLMNYCTNVCFYTMLKAKRVSLIDHPIVKRLVSYRKLMKELEPVDEKMTDDITTVLQCVKSGRDLTEVLDTEERKAPQRQKQTLRVLKRHLEPVEENTGLAPTVNELLSKTKNKRKKSESLETADEKVALELYGLMKAAHQRTKSVKFALGGNVEKEDDDDDARIEDDQMNTEGSDNGNDPEGTSETIGKRKITYQIAKNKGLTPYRKKEVRNPRVKNRMKYKKAKIRRKGQVREARKEVTKYSGEISGIKATSSRSIKLK